MLRLDRRAISRRQKEKRGLPGQPGSPPSCSPPALMSSSAMFSPSSLGSLTPPHSSAPSFSDSPSSRGVSPPALPAPSSSYASYINSSHHYPPPHNPHHSMPKFEPAQLQKYEGAMPSFDLGGVVGMQPKYEAASPTKFEPKYEPNLSVEHSSSSSGREVGGGELMRSGMVEAPPRNILVAPENNSISMTLMQ